MSNEYHHRTPKLAFLAAKFIAASEVHEEAQSMAGRAWALDHARELEAAEHGIEFEEIVRETMRVAETQKQVVTH